MLGTSQISPDPTRETAFAAFSCGSSNVNVLGMEDYYETDGEGARQDFAIRSGLVQGCRVFGKEEIRMLYHACMVCIQADADMTFEGEKKLWEVMEKLEENLPELESDGQDLENAEKAGNRPIQETVDGAGLFWEGEEYEQE